MNEEHTQEVAGSEQPGKMKVAWLILMHVVEGVYDFVGRNVAVVLSAKELFLGSALTIIGLMSFETDRFCDGNTADYLSCTRPNAYYYFDSLDIALVVLGITLILCWFIARRHR